MKLDNLDLEILNFILENPKISNRKIANKIGKSTPTVGERILKMEKNGIINGYYTFVSGEKIGIYKEIFLFTIFSNKENKIKKILEIDNVRRVIKCEQGKFIAIFSYEKKEEEREFVKMLERNKINYEKFPIIEELKIKNEAIMKSFIKKIYCDYCGKEITGDVILKRINGEEKHFCCKTCSTQYLKKLTNLKTIIK